MAANQRDISVSEFFVKNRHLLGFDNKRKALLTTVKEAVDNSLDACEEAGILPDLEITVRQTDQDRFSVSVRDNGPGIDEKIRPRIFNKGVTTKGEGKGLGLYLSKRIVESYGGTIELLESKVGTGAAFLISVPVL